MTEDDIEAQPTARCASRVVDAALPEFICMPPTAALLSQFLSPRSNQREDPVAGRIRARLYWLVALSPTAVGPTVVLSS